MCEPKDLVEYIFFNLDILCEIGTMRNGGGYILQKHCCSLFLEVGSGTIATIFIFIFKISTIH
jgi:hypothetical protein